MPAIAAQSVASCFCVRDNYNGAGSSREGTSTPSSATYLLFLFGTQQRAVSRRIIMGKRVLRRKGGRDRRILWNGGEFNWKLVITVITSSSSRLGIGRRYWGKKSWISIGSVSIVKYSQ